MQDIYIKFAMVFSFVLSFLSGIVVKLGWWLMLVVNGTY